MTSLPLGTIKNYNVQQLREESPFVFTILNLTNSLTNLFLGAVAMNYFVYANAVQLDYVSQHIYLCVFGYVILMPQAILSINIHTGWARAFSCENKRAIHYILQLGGSMLGLAGCTKIMAVHSRTFYRDMPAHAYLGLFVMLLTILNLIGGVVNLNSSKICLKKNFLKIAHSTLGFLTIIFAFTAMLLPAKGNIGDYYNSTNEILFLCLVIISVILILASPIMSARKLV